MRGLIAIAATALCLACVTAPAHAAVTVSSAQTQNMSCSSGICAPTATKAVLNVGDLENLLASGGVTVTTTGSGVQAKNINVSAPLSWPSSNALSLDAHDSVSVAMPVSVSGTGGLSITTRKTNGAFSFGPGGSISFANVSSSLTINRKAFVLVNSVGSLANAIASNPAGSYALADSYNASQDGTYSNSPIATTLTGAVQGLGNTISNLSIDNQNAAMETGLFAMTGAGSAIENLRVLHADVQAQHRKTGRAIGVLVGVNGGVLFGDEAMGSAGNKHCSPCSVGGLAGGNGGAIMSSSANVRVEGTSDAGGLVGTNGGTIELSHAEGIVKGTSLVGGLVGDNDRGTITQSFATGSATGTDGSRVGGLVGLNESSGDVNNSYATGAATGGADTEVGGFIGENNSTIEDSYSTGAVAGGTGSLVGGFTGGGSGYSFATCYWDTTTSGTDQGTGGGNIDGITGLTTEQLQSGLPNGFESTIWAEDSKINDGLPYLINNPPLKQ